MRLWRALEEVPGCAAVLAEWEWRLGDELRLLKPYLQPRSKRAAFFPRLDGGNPALMYRVVEHGDDFVGVCDETEERIPLRRQDLVVYEVDRKAMLGSVAASLGLTTSFEEAVFGEAIDLIGHLRPTAGFQFPVYWLAMTEPARLRSIVSAIVSHTETPFILAAPTTAGASAAVLSLLERRQSMLLAAREAVQLTEANGWAASDLARERLAAFVNRHVPVPAPTQAGTFFPTPPGATWRDLTIRFVDGHTVSVRIGDASMVCHYTQLGMADGRNAKPTKQWELLAAFAKNGGVLTWRSPEADRRNKKRRELLARDLRSIFRIDGDPIVAHENGWRTAFRLEADR